MDEATGDAGDEEGVDDLELNGVLEWCLAGGEHLVEGLGLDDGSWEAVEYEAALALLVVFKLVLDHANDDVVGDQSTLVHDLLGLLAELSALCDLGAEHVSGGLPTQLAYIHGRIRQGI